MSRVVKYNLSGLIRISSLKFGIGELGMDENDTCVKVLRYRYRNRNWFRRI